MRAAWKVTAPEESEKRLEQLARFLDRDYESAARSLREGMAEMFTLQRLKLPPSLHKCPTAINLIESPQSGVARRTANVKYGVIGEWSGVGLPRPGYSLDTASEKSPAIKTVGRSPRFPERKTGTEISQEKVV